MERVEMSSGATIADQSLGGLPPPSMTRWGERPSSPAKRTFSLGLSVSTVPCPTRSEEHTSELQSLMRISYAVFCLNKKKTQISQRYHTTTNNITLHQ